MTVPDLPPAKELGMEPSRWSGLLRSVVLPLALLALILGGLWYWDSQRGGSRSDAYGVVDLPDDRNPTGEGPEAKEGRAAPDFLLERPAGGTLRLSDLQGQPVLVNFWASWCAPCQREMPELVLAGERYAGQGLVIVGVNLQEPDRMVLNFAGEYGIEFPLVVDRDGELSDIWRLGGPIQGIPTSYFIDETGVIRELYYGPMDEEDLAERLAAIGIES